MVEKPTTDLPIVISVLLNAAQSTSPLTNDPPTVLDPLDLAQAPKMNDPSINKNDWTLLFPDECKKHVYQETFFCDYYAFYSDNSAFLEPSNLSAPTSMNGCDNTKLFSYTPYAVMSATQRVLRHHCFPNYSEYTSADVPSVSSSQMLSVDPVEFTIRWNKTIAEEVAGIAWLYAAEEKTDDAETSRLVGF